MLNETFCHKGEPSGTMDIVIYRQDIQEVGKGGKRDISGSQIHTLSRLTTRLLAL